jgi:hypothetical protein
VCLPEAGPEDILNCRPRWRKSEGGYDYTKYITMSSLSLTRHALTGPTQRLNSPGHLTTPVPVPAETFPKIRDDTYFVSCFIFIFWCHSSFTMSHETIDHRAQRLQKCGKLETASTLPQLTTRFLATPTPPPYYASIELCTIILRWPCLISYPPFTREMQMGSLMSCNLEEYSDSLCSRKDNTRMS